MQHNAQSRSSSQADRLCHSVLVRLLILSSLWMDHAAASDPSSQHRCLSDALFTQRLRSLVAQRRRLTVAALTTKLTHLVNSSNSTGLTHAHLDDQSVTNDHATEHELQPPADREQQHELPLTTCTTTTTTISRSGDARSDHASVSSRFLPQQSLSSQSDIDNSREPHQGHAGESSLNNVLADSARECLLSKHPSHSADLLSERFALLDMAMSLKDDIRAISTTLVASESSPTVASTKRKDIHEDQPKNASVHLSANLSTWHSARQNGCARGYRSESPSGHSALGVDSLNGLATVFRPNSNVFPPFRNHESVPYANETIARLFFDCEFRALFHQQSSSNSVDLSLNLTPQNLLASYFNAVADHNLLLHTSTGSANKPQDSSLLENSLGPGDNPAQRAIASHADHAATHLLQHPSIAEAADCTSQSFIDDHFPAASMFDSKLETNERADLSLTRMQKQSPVHSEQVMQTRTYHRDSLDLAKERYLPNAPWAPPCVSRSTPQEDVELLRKLSDAKNASKVYKFADSTRESVPCTYNADYGYNSYRIYPNGAPPLPSDNSYSSYFQRQTNFPFRAMPLPRQQSRQDRAPDTSAVKNGSFQESKVPAPLEGRLPVGHLSEPLKELVIHGTPSRPSFFAVEGSDKFHVRAVHDSDLDVFCIGSDGMLKPSSDKSD